VISNTGRTCNGKCSIQNDSNHILTEEQQSQSRADWKTSIYHTPRQANPAPIKGTNADET
jgi:hypothetical protein